MGIRDRVRRVDTAKCFWDLSVFLDFDSPISHMSVRLSVSVKLLCLHVCLSVLHVCLLD